LKLENVLITEDGHVKLCDLGFSVHINGQQETNTIPSTTTSDMISTTLCGTPVFMAPEVLASCRRYNALEADMWSM